MEKNSSRKDRLWYFAQQLLGEETKECEFSQLEEEHINKIRIKFSQLVNNLTCIGDIVSHLLENEKLTWKEYESIQHLQPTAILANEELLRIIASKSRDVYDCFLSALKKTNQDHLHGILESAIEYEIETSVEKHKDVIRRNFTWLSDKLNSENELVAILYERKVLSLRERETIGTTCDRFKKNEDLLTVISRKSSEDFAKFLSALEDTNQSHIVSKLWTSEATPTGATKKFPPPVPPKKAKVLPQKGKPEVSLTESTEIIKGSHSPSKIKIIRDENRLSKLENQLQTEISIKVIGIRQRTIKRSEDILKFCERRVLQESLQTKRKDSQIADEMEQLNRKVSQYSAAASLNDSLRAEIISMKKEIKSQNDFILKTNSDREKLRSNLDVVKEEIINEKLKCKQLKEDKLQCEDKLKRAEERLLQCNDNEKKCLEELRGTKDEILMLRLKREEDCKESDLKIKFLETEKDELYKKNEKLMLENEKYLEIEKQLFLSEENGREVMRQVEEATVSLRICERQKNELEKNLNALRLSNTQVTEELEEEKRLRKEQDDKLSETTEKQKETQAELEKTTLKLNDVLHLSNELRFNEEANTTVWTNNHQFLVENIDSNPLSNLLCSRNCITVEEQDRINRRKSDFLRKEDLIQCLKFAARKLDNRLIIYQCLHETSQNFMADVLEIGGVVVMSKLTSKIVIPKKIPFLSKTPAPEKISLDFNESIVVDELNRLASQYFHEGYDSPTELSDLAADGIYIAPYCRQEDCGIIVWFWCTSQGALRILREIYVSGVLFDRMSDLYKKLTKPTKDSPSSSDVNLTLTSLTIFQHDLTKETDANLEFSGYENDPMNFESLLTLGYYDPRLIASVNTKSAENDHTEIYGITSLRGMIYVVNGYLQEVDVYDMDSLTLKRRFIVDNLKEPRDIVACPKNEVLYIVDGNIHGQPMNILAVDVNGIILKTLWQGHDWGRLSISYDSNIILSVLDKNKILEISPDGQLIREIKLNVLHPWHALKLSDDRYFLGCGTTGNGGLCLVNGDGETISFRKIPYKTRSHSSLFPINLAIDKAGTIFVVDESSGRILLLTLDFVEQREFITRKHGLKYPRRLILDEATSRLFVADNVMIGKGGRILVYDIGNPSNTK